MTQQRGRKKQTLFQLIRDFERKKMADAEPAIVQMFDASGDSEAICEFETYKKVFTRGETYFYKSPGDFAHNGSGAATPEEIMAMNRVLTDDAHPDKNCKYHPYGPEIPNVAEMMAANLAITRTTQCEVSQEDLMRDPRNERKLGIWKTKRDPAMWYDDVHWQTLILSSRGSRFGFRSDVGRVIKHLEGRAILDFPDHPHRSQVLDAPTYIEIEAGVRFRLIVDSEVHLMRVGYSGDTPPKETIDGWNDGGMSNKRTTDMISPIADEATRSIKKTKFADTIIKSPSQKVPKSGTPGSSGLPSPGKPAVEKKGKAHPVKTGLAQRGRPPGIKTQALRLANGVNSTLKTPSTGTLEQVQQSPVLPQSSTTMTSDDRQTPKTSVDYMQESDTEATDDESSDDDQEPKIDWTKRMADINQTQTQPVQTPLTSTPLLTPSNIMSTDRLRALKVAAASATHAEKLLMETKDLAEKAQKIFTQEKQLWIEGKTRLTAENDRLKVLLDEQRLKRKKMEEGFKEKIKDAKEQKKAAEKFASEVEERMKALTLEKSAVEAELIQLRREVEMDE